MGGGRGEVISTKSKRTAVLSQDTFPNLLPLSGRPHKSPGAPTLVRGGKSRRGQGAKVLIQQNIGKQGRNSVTEGRVGKRF